MTTKSTSRTRTNLPHKPMASGQPRPGGKLARFIANRDTTLHPIIEDDLVYVSVEGLKHRRAVLGLPDFQRLTARDPSGPWLTRTRWWFDDAGMLRAFSLHEKPMEHGVLVAAAILGAKEGDTLDLPADPLDLRRSQMKRA